MITECSLRPFALRSVKIPFRNKNNGISTDLKGNGRKLHSAIIGKIFPISEQCHHLKINLRGFLLYGNDIF